MAQTSGGFGLGACWTPHVTQIHSVARSAIESPPSDCVELGGSLAGGIGTLWPGPSSVGMEVGRISAAGVNTALKQDDTGGFGFGEVGVQ